MNIRVNNNTVNAITMNNRRKRTTKGLQPDKLRSVYKFCDPKSERECPFLFVTGDPKNSNNSCHLSALSSPGENEKSFVRAVGGGRGGSGLLLTDTQE